MHHCSIIATAGAVPSLSINNDYFNPLGSSGEWIKQRTGIENRRWVQNETLIDLISEVALSLKESATAEIDGLIVATCTPPKTLPNCAHLVANRVQVEGFLADVNVACCGFVHALNLASSLIKCGQYQNLMVIGADLMSQVIDKNDRGTAVLFGDGAGGVLISRSQEVGILDFMVASQAQKMDLIMDEGSWQEGVVPRMTMRGQEVFKLAIRSQVRQIRALLNKHHWAVSDVDYFFFHQANKRIIQAAADLLKIEDRQLLYNIQDLGNTSAASIPLVMHQGNSEGRFQPGMRMVGSAVGAGMSTSTFLMEWSE